jgi:hypothetical protein
VVPYEYVRELLGFQKGAPKKVDVHGGTVGVSYVVTKFAKAPGSLLVYYTITDVSTSTRIQL